MSAPWRGDLKCGTGSSDAWIFDEDGDDVAQAHPYMLPAIARDRAESLVHRVNAYDGLVEALEDILATRCELADAEGYLEDVRDTARAALAATKEGK